MREPWRKNKVSPTEYYKRHRDQYQAQPAQPVHPKAVPPGPRGLGEMGEGGLGGQGGMGGPRGPGGMGGLGEMGEGELGGPGGPGGPRGPGGLGGQEVLPLSQHHVSYVTSHHLLHKSNPSNNPKYPGLSGDGGWRHSGMPWGDGHSGDAGSWRGTTHLAGSTSHNGRISRPDRSRLTSLSNTQSYSSAYSETSRPEPVLQLLGPTRTGRLLHGSRHYRR